VSHFYRFDFTLEAQFSYRRYHLVPRDIHPLLSDEFHDIIVVVYTGAHWYRAESEPAPLPPLLPRAVASLPAVGRKPTWQATQA
jgi:hypothetical protein